MSVKLGSVQLRIMRVLWARGEATAREITDDLSRDGAIAHSTVQTLLRKLEAKGAQVSLKDILRLEPDCGVTNIRNTSSKDWQRWLGPENRCLVPFTSFSEYDTIDGKKVRVWFAADADRPLLSFRGI